MSPQNPSCTLHLLLDMVGEFISTILSPVDIYEVHYCMCNCWVAGTIAHHSTSAFLPPPITVRPGERGREWWTHGLRHKDIFIAGKACSIKSYSTHQIYIGCSLILCEIEHLLLPTSGHISHDTQHTMREGGGGEGGGNMRVKQGQCTCSWWF